MTTVHDHRREELIRIVQATPWFMQALNAAGSLHLQSWCIGAGAVRNLVWDYLHGFSKPSTLADIDLAYFDPDDLRPETEQQLQAELEAHFPSFPWEVTNQAAVHLWFESHFGHPVSPLISLEQAIASWPEYATSVGITMNPESKIHVVAPYGLEDLFEVRVRRNPARVSKETYRQRNEQKQYASRWPRVTVVPCEEAV